MSREGEDFKSIPFISLSKYVTLCRWPTNLPLAAFLWEELSRWDPSEKEFLALESPVVVPGRYSSIGIGLVPKNWDLRRNQKVTTKAKVCPMLVSSKGSRNLWDAPQVTGCGPMALVGIGARS